MLPYSEIYSLNLLLESQGEKNYLGTGPGMMRRPVWGGPQAAGKRHSQPFSAKRLPHPRGVCRPTKPVFVDTGVAVERSTPLLVPVRHFRCFRLLTFRMIIMSHLCSP